jgi:type III secretory pathway component EscV
MAAPERTILSVLASRSDIVLALAVVGIITVLVIPMPAALLDFARPSTLPSRLWCCSPPCM